MSHLSLQKFGMFLQFFRHLFALLACVGLSLEHVHAQADRASPAPEQKLQFHLESIAVSGTERIDSQRLAEELGLSVGSVIDTETIANAQISLLGLGLFRSAILSIRKGQKPGWVILWVELEDEPTVIGPWGVGTTLSLLYGEFKGSNFDQDTSPFATRLQVVGRNLFGQMHRAYTLFDIDGGGTIREFEIAYGLPRFSREKVQFDAKLNLVDTEARFLQGMGFGARAESQWRYDVSNLSSVSYGLAMYLNRPGRFSYPDMPDSVVGPKLGFRWESRLLSFVPQAGYLFESNLLLAPGQETTGIIELQTAATWSLLELAYFTLDLKAAKAGTPEFISRSEGRIDIPLSQSRHDQAALFISGRHGYDKVSGNSRFGSDLTFGIRYHSPGFIAELSFRYTESPEPMSRLVDAGGRGL
ncbi:MAG: hypothetical protein ACOH5I_03200 [Oligoflexus sp.]